MSTAAATMTPEAIQAPAPRPKKDKVAVTVPEAAELLSISKAQAYKMIYAGEIPHFFIGRQMRVPVKQLEARIDRKLREAGYEDA